MKPGFAKNTVVDSRGVLYFVHPWGQHERVEPKEKKKKGKKAQ